MSGGPRAPLGFFIEQARTRMIVRSFGPDDEPANDEHSDPICKVRLFVGAADSTAG